MMFRHITSFNPEEKDIERARSTQCDAHRSGVEANVQLIAERGVLRVRKSTLVLDGSILWLLLPKAHIN
jgi:hypothetical protein